MTYPIIKNLVKDIEKEIEKTEEPNKEYDWMSFIYNTFFSTGREINKQKET